MIMNNVANEFFGEMRYLTPEENERKKEMYRKMSTNVDGTGFNDWLFADLDELIDCDFEESEMQEDET
jgi:hypothetical protein